MGVRQLGLGLALVICVPLSAALAQAPAGLPGHENPHVLAAPRGPVRQAPRGATVKTGEKAKSAGKAAHKSTVSKSPAKAPGSEHVDAAGTAAGGKPGAKPAPPPDSPGKGSVTGLPLPRFASLRADDVNLRAGPGQRYPIEWLYKRRGLPVQIDREFEVWRLVTAPDGVKGWVHEATLFGRRDFVVTGADRTLRKSAEATARAVAILQPGVVGRIRSCAAGADWCQVQVGDYRGWLRRGDFWGALPNEAIAPG